MISLQIYFYVSVALFPDQFIFTRSQSFGGIISFTIHF